MKIVSIDPGTRNLGLAVYKDNKLIHFNSYDLFEYVHKKKRTDYSYVVHEFIKKSPQIFNDVDVVLIENQMKAKFKVIAHSFRCFFFDKAIKLSPLAVRKYFKISKSDYKKNKKASIMYVQKFLNTTQLKRFKAHKKKDDLSDAIIMIQYYLQTKK